MKRVVKAIFWFFENMFGSRWKPNDMSTEFLRQARRDGYYYARTLAFFSGQQVKRDRDKA